MDNLVSVVIPTYNNAQFVCDAIDSVLAQTYKNYEILLIDDGSKDNTGRVIEKYDGKQIRYIYQENKGLAGARNTGIKASRGELIAFLDADDMWLPEKLERQAGLMNAFPNVGLVGCGYYGVDESGERVKEMKGRNYLNKELLLNDLMVRNVVTGSGSGVLARKECFEKAGLFDESFRSTEDRDMWYRILNFYDLKFVTDYLVVIRVRKNSLSKNVAMMKFSQKKFIQKHLKKMDFAKKCRAYGYVYLDAAREYSIARKQLLAAANASLSIVVFPFKVYPDDDKYKILIKSFLPKRLLAAIKGLMARKQLNKNE